MGTAVEIYNFSQILDAVERRIDKMDVMSKNKELVFQFRDFFFANGVREPRIISHLENLSRIMKWMRKDFENVEKRDIEALLGRINRMNLSAWTKHNYKRTIKAFWTWLGKSDVVEWIKLTPPSKYKLPDEILDEEEILRMEEACMNLRDKAIVRVLYEGGFRVGEFLAMKIKDVKFDEMGAVVTVDGKTGMRRVRLVSSVPALIRWLDVHPARDDSTAYLWIKTGNSGRGELMDYDNLRMQLKKIAKRAGIKKRVYPHLFRHSRATHLANYLTEAQMCEFFGWVQGSDMPRIYIHLSGRDVDEAILSMYGLGTNEKRTPKVNAIKCPRCEAINDAKARFCMRCAFPLAEDAQVDLIALQDEVDKAIEAYMKDPLFRQVIDELQRRGVIDELMEKLKMRK